MDQEKKITILGSTGSIGTQALDVISKTSAKHEIIYLTTNSKIDLLQTQIDQFNPKGVVIADRKSYEKFRANSNYKGKILFGNEGLIEASSDNQNELVISSLVGFSGVEPTLAALKNSINVALANKETLVSAGKLITETAQINNAAILAVDSEHNAILQCLVGENLEEIEKIILTASGGPFRETPLEKFNNISVQEALNHPNWSMGSKVTIDSATMMNKGFEVIEAYWLFGLSVDKIDVTVHPQSIIHSMVQFVDGSVKAQLGLPDMRTPISFAINYPKRYYYDYPRMDINEIAELTFFKPDLEKFKCLSLAFECLKIGGTAPATLNAANEVLVSEFLKENISFIDIPSKIEQVLNNIEIIDNPSLDEIKAIDQESRLLTQKLIYKN